MKTPGLLIAAVLSVAVLLSAAATVKEPGKAPIPESHGRNIGAAVATENRKLEMDEEQSLGMAQQEQKSVVSAADDATVPPEEGKFAGRSYKICLTPGPCYKKKLVCPKQCSGGGGIARVQPNHIPGMSCVLDCKKCSARC